MDTSPRSVGTMNADSGRHAEHDGPFDEDPDQEVREYEDDESIRRQARIDEAADIALAAPGGIEFEPPAGDVDGHRFDAENNP